MSAGTRAFLVTLGAGSALILLLWASAAGAVVLGYGTVAALVVAAVASVQAHRWDRDSRALATSIRQLGTPKALLSAGVSADRGGRFAELFRHLADAEERIEREFRFLESERRRGFQVLGHMADGVIAVSASRQVSLLNPAARQLLSLSRESRSGRPLAEVVRIPQVLDAVESVLAGEGPREFSLDLPATPPRTLRLLAVKLPSDGPAGALVTVRDETQSRRVEAMRREFVANVSHELKTPLAAIKGYTETLQLGAKDDADACRHFLEQIQFQSSRLERLINDMLQLARAQAGPKNLVVASVRLLPLLAECMRTYEPLARGHDIELRLDGVSDGAAVMADREALVTILNNLVGNALRYTPAGGHVAVAVRPEGPRWAIAVADDGVGIPSEDQQRVFERFYRVEKARDASRGGTGLGLAIVKNLVQALDGEVRVRSKLGEGTTFEVVLPAAGS